MCLSLPLLSGIALSTLLATSSQAQELDAHRDVPEGAFTTPLQAPEMREPGLPVNANPDYGVDGYILYVAPKS